MDEVKTISELIDEIISLDAEIKAERIKLEGMPANPISELIKAGAAVINEPVTVEFVHEPMQTDLAKAKQQVFRLARENERLRIELEGHRYLNCGELADALGKHRNYITHMKNAGFSMPGNRATLSEARKWIAQTGFTRCSG